MQRLQLCLHQPSICVNFMYRLFYIAVIEYIITSIFMAHYCKLVVSMEVIVGLKQKPAVLPQLGPLSLLYPPPGLMTLSPVHCIGQWIPGG